MPIEAGHLDQFKRDEETGFVFPDYSKYCVSNIAPSIVSFFGGKRERPTLPEEFYRSVMEDAQKIVILLIDGFGYNHFIRYQNSNFIKKLISNGTVSPITTVFPSTTAAALTSINTGLTPQEHALPEWFVYFREIEMVLITIPFKPMDPRDNSRFRNMRVNPKIIYEGRTVYQDLVEIGIKPFVFIPEKTLGSVYSGLIHRGGATIPYVNTSDLMVRLRRALEKSNIPSFFFVYVDILDYISHKYSPDSEEFMSQLETLSFQFKNELIDKINEKVARETLLLVTADHGQTSVYPEGIIFVDDHVSGAAHFKKNSRGEAIPPTGSPRDVFLNIESLELLEIKNSLSKELSKKAKLMYSEEALRSGLFGLGGIRSEFYNRIGNLLVIPLGKNLIWYKQPGISNFEFLGHHGGLTEDEMLVPFAAARLCDLK